MRSAHRWMTDQKIFVVRRRRPGGAVLVDCSGSMSLKQQQLLDILIGVPGALIATYNGNGEEGTLRIVANLGRVCSEDLIKPPGGLNTIDGPALGWLGKQPGPRLWVSDGWVNGRRGGATSENLYFDRDILISQHQIKWIDPHIVGFDKIVEATVDTLLRP